MTTPADPCDASIVLGGRPYFYAGDQDWHHDQDVLAQAIGETADRVHDLLAEGIGLYRGLKLLVAEAHPSLLVELAASDPRLIALVHTPPCMAPQPGLIAVTTVAFD